MSNYKQRQGMDEFDLAAEREGIATRRIRQVAPDRRRRNEVRDITPMSDLERELLGLAK